MTTTATAPAPAPDDAPRRPQPPVLRLRDAPEVLAYLPHRLGFQPRDSLVVAGVGGRRRRLGLVARVDLADLVGPAGPLLAHDLVAHLLADGADEVLIAAHTATDPREALPDGRLRPDPGSQAVLAVDRFDHAWEARRPGGRSERWVVLEAGYLALDCPDAACCPLGGRPLRDLADSAAGRRLAATGTVVAPDRAALGRIDPAGPGGRRSADSARLRWSDRLRRARRSGPPPGAVEGTAGQAEAGAPAGEAASRDHDDDTVAARATPWQAEAVRRWRSDSLDLWIAAVAASAPADPGADEEGADGEGADGEGGTDRRDGDRPRPDGPGTEQPDVDRPGVGGPGASGPGADLRGAGASGAREGETAGAGAPPAAPGVRVRPVRGPAPRVLGRIEAALADQVLRDAVLLAILDPSSDLPRQVIREGDGGRGSAEGPAGPRIGAALDGLLLPGTASRPDPAAVAAAVVVLERVVAHGRVGRQASALTLLALVAWWSGDGPRASVLVERALHDDPEHVLGRLVDRLVGSGVPPAWLAEDR